MGVAAALVLVLGGWLQSAADADIAAHDREREALLLANAVSASLAGVPEDGVNQRLQAWREGSLAIESLQLVAGRQLLGSTRAEDEAPRSLKLAEKPLFDLIAALRAAAETNASEGVTRKKTIQLEDKGGVVTVGVPYRVKGKIEGIVQARVKPAVRHVGASGGPGLALGVFAAALVIGALLRVDPARRFDTSRAIAVAALLAIVIGYQQQRLAAMREVLAASDAAIGQVQAAAAALSTSLGAQAPTGQASPWDIDHYGRPLGLVSPAGELLAKSGVVVRETRTVFLERSLWAVDVIGLAALLFFVQGYAARSWKAFREHADAYAYTAPAMIGMLLLVFFPFFYGIGLSFTDTTLFNESAPFRERWIGLDNYVQILGDFNIVTKSVEGTVVNYQNFYWTLMMTVIWTVTNVSIGVSFGFVLALALNTEGLKAKPIYRVLLILPWAIPNYITALVWRGMFHPQFGVINQVLQMFGLKPVAWFDGVFSSFMTGLATNGWLSFPFMMVVILGALQSIPKDMYEAAEVEGATRWQRLRRITLPLLRPTLVPAIVLSVVWTFNMFNIIFLVSGGEPAGANEILITKAYKIAFEQYQYAYAAAYSTVIFVILLVYGYFQTRLTRATESY